ncbi:MAG TPA: MFS transporter [Chloroflexota bacterium]|nr:MFS transporter [Chloroflexota bacterium]
MRGGHGWLLPGLVAATFLSLLHYLSFSPLLPAIAAELHLDVGTLGQLPAAIGVGAAFIGLAAGPLADRYGKRHTLLLGVLALVVSSAGLAFLPGLALLPAIALLAALGRATVYPLALAIASAEYEGDLQRRAVSRITSSLGPAPILGVPLVTAVATMFDWRAAWLALSVLTAVALLWLWRVLQRPGGWQSTLASRPLARPLFAAYAPLLRHRPSMALVGGTFALGAGGWIVWTYLGAFVIQRHGFTTQEAGWVWTIVGIGLFAGSILVGGPLGRAPQHALFSVAALGAGACLGLAMLLPVNGWLAAAIVGVGTLLHGATQVVTAIWLPKSAPTGRAATMTLRGAASSLGAAGGAALGGVLLSVADFAALGASAIVFCALGAALGWWAHTPVGRTEQPQAIAAVRALGGSSIPSSATHAAT